MSDGDIENIVCDIDKKFRIEDDNMPENSLGDS